MTLTKKPTFLQSIIPIIVLICLLSFSVLMIWGDASVDGANQMALLFAAAVALVIGWRLDFTWKQMIDGIGVSITSAIPAMIILLLIGSLAGTWLISGIVPTMVYYGLKILHPSIFLFSACIISAIISLATGSSWGTIATIGVALLAIGSAMGFNEALVAGAIISGAYFGDKLSPMSDTTNLAPLVAGTDLISHIKYMLWTTIPSIVITLIIFLIIGFSYEPTALDTSYQDIFTALENAFYISPILFIVPAVVILLIVLKLDAIPAIFVGVILGAIFAMAFQPKIIENYGTKNHIEISGNIEGLDFQWIDESGEVYESSEIETQGDLLKLVVSEDGINKVTADLKLPSGSENSENIDISYYKSNLSDLGLSLSVNRTNYLVSCYKTMIDAMTVDFSVATENDSMNDLLSTGGMKGMLGTIWLILCAMIFGGALETLGMLHKITQVLVSRVERTGSLVATTALTCIGFNVTASDQYLAIVVPGKMFSGEYKKRNLDPKLLSRTLEDSGTVTSVLIPWNTCGAAQSKVLGVYTGDYFIYCFFNLISPVMTMLFAFFGIKIAKKVNRDNT